MFCKVRLFPRKSRASLAGSLAENRQSSNGLFHFQRPSVTKGRLRVSVDINELDNTLYRGVYIQIVFLTLCRLGIKWWRRESHKAKSGGTFGRQEFSTWFFSSRADRTPQLTKRLPNSLQDKHSLVGIWTETQAILETLIFFADLDVQHSHVWVLSSKQISFSAFLACAFLNGLMPFFSLYMYPCLIHECLSMLGRQ